MRELGREVFVELLFIKGNYLEGEQVGFKLCKCKGKANEDGLQQLLPSKTILI